jgi:TetR/AcrR family tetracycline transcriptional repressor
VLPPQPSSRNQRDAVPQATAAEAITQAALRVVRQHGLEGLTMRRLSAELGSSLGAAYYHVPSKRALLELMMDCTIGSLPTPGPEHGDWASRIETMLLASWQMFVEYPGIEQLLRQHIGQRHADRLTEFVRACLHDAGFSSPEATVFESLIGNFSIGVAVVVSDQPRNRQQVLANGAEALTLLLDHLRSRAALLARASN